MSSKSKKIVYKRNKKLNKIYHPDSGLVIKSAKEKVVIGRIDGDEFVPLDDTALDLCEEWNLKYDESLVEVEEEAESSEEEVVEPKASKKSKSKDDSKKSDEEEDSEDEEEEPEKKATPKPSKTSKPSKSVSKNDEVDVSAVHEGIPKILARHAKELEEFIAGLTPADNGDSERVAELEKELAETKKELAETKKKLKGVLAAMQGSL